MRFPGFSQIGNRMSSTVWLLSRRQHATFEKDVRRYRTNIEFAMSCEKAISWTMISLAALLMREVAR